MMFDVAGGIIVAFALIALLKGGKKLFSHENGGTLEAWLGIFVMAIAVAAMCFVVLFAGTQ